MTYNILNTYYVPTTSYSDVCINANSIGEHCDYMYSIYANTTQNYSECMSSKIFLCQDVIRPSSQSGVYSFLSLETVAYTALALYILPVIFRIIISLPLIAQVIKGVAGEITNNISQKICCAVIPELREYQDKRQHITQEAIAATQQSLNIISSVQDLSTFTQLTPLANTSNKLTEIIQRYEGQNESTLSEILTPHSNTNETHQQEHKKHIKATLANLSTKIYKLTTAVSAASLFVYAGLMISSAINIVTLTAALHLQALSAIVISTALAAASKVAYLSACEKDISKTIYNLLIQYDHDIQDVIHAKRTISQIQQSQESNTPSTACHAEEAEKVDTQQPSNMVSQASLESTNPAQTQLQL